MSVAVVRIEALRALAALIQLKIPELRDRVCVGVSGEHEEMPNLSIQPTVWNYEPEQQGEHATLPGNVVVWNNGQHTCACVLSIVAPTPGQRWTLEAKVLSLFLESRHPLTDMPLAGVLVVPVTSCPQLSRWVASFDLESDTWNDNNAQDKRLESRITVNAQIPALSVQTPVYTINSLILGVTEDMDSTFTPDTAIPPVVELVSINEDGSITRIT